MATTCPLCEAVKACQTGLEPLLIHEFTHSYWLFGQHQFYPGYSVLVLKNHARELHTLPKTVQMGVFDELMQAGSAVEAVFKPWKLNYASYGNVVEHIHWHIFPRYESEETRFECPFGNNGLFKNYPINIAEIKQKGLLLKNYLEINK